MTLFKAIVLGIFQGVAEFLPISSSGHLVLLQTLFGIKEGNLFFTEMLHFGTLLSIFIVYFKDIFKIIVEFFILIKDFFKTKRLIVDNTYKKMAMLIIVGSIPTGIMGIALGDIFESFYSSITVVAIAFIITGVLLWISEKSSLGNKSVKEVTYADSFIIGVFQGFAITPGISRSGSTIVGGLFRGLDKKLATKFSFLLALPATFGAAILGIKDALPQEAGTLFTIPLLIGVLISTITGIISIKILIRVLERGKLHYFSYYVWILSVILLIANTF